MGAGVRATVTDPREDYLAAIYRLQAAGQEPVGTTELARVLTLLTALALGHPRVAFCLRHEGRVLLPTSGTVSTELAFAGAPMVIGYRFQPLSYAIMKPFFTGKYATLFNQAAEAEIARELIQKDATPEGFAAEVGRLLDDPAARADQTARQTAALDRMGREGRDPSEIAAEAVLAVTKAGSSA